MTDAGVRYRTKQLLAIEAIAAGRFSQAHALVLELLDDTERPIVPGQCRYCACTELQPCGVMVVPSPEFQPSIVPCSWADDERTICTNARCLDRWQREQPVRGDDTSRLVLP